MSLKEFTPEEFRQFIQNRHEKDYLLVDVRQPGEYEQGHIPGARLLPLPELVQSIDSLPLDKDLVFYCHSGGRSMAAAAMVEEEIGQATLYNLTGGILAWDGGMVADYPKVQLFSMLVKPAEMLQAAMNMEKGALNFYTQVCQQFGHQSWSKVFERLAKAEIGHAKTVYHFRLQFEPKGGEFDKVFEALSGDVLEGGMTLATAMERAMAAESRVCIRLLELALQIEYAAFDLYRSMADRITAPDAQEAFLTIAQAEKAHMRALVDALDECPT